MANNCSPLLTTDMVFDCAQRSKKGLDAGKAVLINKEDIDYSASVISGSKITSLVLKAGKTGYAAEWFKELASVNSSFAPSKEDVDGFLHNFLCTLQAATAESALRSAELSQGRFLAVVETKFKGTNSEDAYKVLGWDCGMMLSELTYNSLERNASIPYTLATDEGDTEGYPFNVYLNADYDTSKADFDALFAQV